ncbi:MAG TPA: DUF2961 domain-containing protein [Bacteroidetes bacterium]|nr:DUF2961 domain-containing protein [Bacteroidota bacterium]
MKRKLRDLPAGLIVLFILLTTGSCRQRLLLSELLSGGSIITEKAKMVQVSSYDKTGGNNDRINVHAGDTAVFFQAEGPGLISRIWMTIDSRDPAAHRSLLLQIFWDDETDPSVEVPLGDFFGCGFGYQHYCAQYTGMSSGGYYCYFPMPFRKKARMALVNQSTEELYAFYFHVDYYRLNKKMQARTPYFHAHWARDIRTTSDKNFTAVEAEGKGVFVGMNFSGQPYNNSLFYLEGDEMIYVDHEIKPSIHGTGFEDYFTSGWYFKNGTFSAPYHGLVLLDESNGRVTAYRHHIPDAIPFEKSLKVTYEHGHGNESVADFSTTCYWYQVEPHKPQAMLPAPLRKPLSRPVAPRAIDSRDLNWMEAKNMYEEDMTLFGPDWLGGSQMAFVGSPGEHFTLSIPELEEDYYNITIYATGGPDYGKLEVISNNSTIASIEGNKPEIIPLEAIHLNHIASNDNEIRLVFKFTGPAETQKAGIDAILIEPVRNFITDWQLIGPFDNPRESDDLRYGLDTPYPPEREIDFSGSYDGKNGQVHWEGYSGDGAGYAMGLNKRYQPSEFIISYAYTGIYTPEDTNVPLLIGSDDGLKVFLNKQELYRYLQVNICAPDQDTVMLPLRKGWNELLLKAENNFGGYAFFARIPDAHRKSLLINSHKIRKK